MSLLNQLQTTKIPSSAHEGTFMKMAGFSTKLAYKFLLWLSFSLIPINNEHYKNKYPRRAHH